MDEREVISEIPLLSERGKFYVAIWGGFWMALVMLVLGFLAGERRMHKAVDSYYAAHPTYCVPDPITWLSGWNAGVAGLIVKLKPITEPAVTNPSRIPCDQLAVPDLTPHETHYAKLRTGQTMEKDGYKYVWNDVDGWKQLRKDGGWPVTFCWGTTLINEQHAGEEICAPPL